MQAQRLSFLLEKLVISRRQSGKVAVVPAMGMCYNELDLHFENNLKKERELRVK